jgi:very-short-patch-repair endonuclease
VTSIGPIPVTTAARTLFDLGAVVPRAAVQAAVTDALRQRLVTPERLERCLQEAGGRGHRGAKAVRTLLETLTGHRPESVLELRLIRILRRSGLPEPASQYSIRRGQKVVARVDLAYPDIRLAIEADGYRYHGGPAEWRRDLARRNELTGLGWRVIQVTWEDVTRRPAAVIRQVRTAIRHATDGEALEKP